MKLRNRLIAQLSMLLLITCLVVGVTGYMVARRELETKGKIILQNGVNMALDVVKAYQSQENAGLLTREQAQEQVKQVLMGVRNADGTRMIRHLVDFGENGYFIIYSVDGTELMHPTLEGQNMWEARDHKNPDFFLVQDQIAKALAGGGFTHYSWALPHSGEIKEKLAYAEYEPFWGWVVCASAYLMDFDRGANLILTVTLGLMALTFVAGALVSRHFVRGVTVPVERLLHSMRLAEPCTTALEGRRQKDEIDTLIHGYNDLMGTMRAAEEQIRANEALSRKLAYHDALTDLPNRLMLKGEMQRQILEGIGCGMLFVLDIRDFRLVNNLQGVETGDEVLRVIGRMLEAFQTPERRVGRISGDEFAIWFSWNGATGPGAVEGTTPSPSPSAGVHGMRPVEVPFPSAAQEMQALRAVESLREEFRHMLLGEERSLRVDVRVGYALFPAHGTDFEQCYTAASLALKQAKGLESGVFVCYETRHHQSVAWLEQVKTAIEHGMESGEFYMVYQKKVDPRGIAAPSVEALARWASSDLGPIGPDVFIPVVEKFGMITRFGEMVLRLVLSDFEGLRTKYGQDVSVSINVAALHLFDANFSQRLFSTIRRYEADPSHVMLEITESSQIEDFQRMTALMRKIKTSGIRFSLDDFGTGYSSLSYIREVPFDELKIDKAFVDGLHTDPNAMTILQAICQMAKAYGMSVVAEGVETREQELMLLEAGVDLIQGYLYSRPERL